MIYVARHGETQWNREGRYQGRLESSLTDTGRAQAEALARALRDKPVTRVVASPLLRCTQTAAPLAAALGVTLETDSRLLEIAHGDWEGRLRSEIQRDDAALWEQWRAHPETVRFRGGESLADVLARWRGFTEQFSGNDEAVVVTHDVVVRLAILDATGRGPAQLWEPRVVNAAYAVFRAGAPWRLEEPCVDDHLTGVAVDPASQAL